MERGEALWQRAARLYFVEKEEGKTKVISGLLGWVGPQLEKDGGAAAGVGVLTIGGTPGTRLT